MLKNWLEGGTGFAFLNPLAWLTGGASRAVTPALAPVPVPMSVPDQPGQGTVTAGEFPAGGPGMRYKLYIPRSHAGRGSPLIVMLHGCRQSADDFACGTQMNVLADQSGCLILYPEQSPAANGIGCWNWFEAANQQRDRGEPASIAGLTRAVIDQYGVDPTRVFIAGLSSGASMAVILGQTYPDLFAAVGSHSGLAYASANSVFAGLMAMRNGANRLRMVATARARRVPTIVFHGDRDATVHPNNGAIIVAQLLRAAPRLDGERVWGRRSSTTHKGRTTGRGYTRKVHVDGAGELIAEHWVVHGSGHAWSGGSADGSYTDVAGPNAGLEMLRFFLSLKPRRAATGPS